MSTTHTEIASSRRVVSIDALRGFVMVVMIAVNDNLNVPGNVVPWWMKHYLGPSGMTYPDVIFPAFLFVVGMAIPFALGGRLDKGEPLGRIVLHILGRTVSLLFLGILAVNGTPDSAKMGWSGPLWCTLTYLFAFIAFCDLSSPGGNDGPVKQNKTLRAVATGLRVAGWIGLIWLALVFRNKNDRPLLTLWPFYIHHIWYGILGYIGWAYLCSAILFLLCRNNLTRILGCAVLLMCLYPASKTGLFDGLWLAKHVNIGIALGSRAFITAMGLLLGTMLRSTPAQAVGRRAGFALVLAAGCACAAILLNGLYGTSKENATPSWSLWGCAITAVLWLLFYFLADLRRIGFISKPLALAGGNVLLAYLISEMLPSALDATGLANWYDSLSQPHLADAVARGAVCSLVIISLTIALNRIGFRLRL